MDASKLEQYRALADAQRDVFVRGSMTDLLDENARLRTALAACGNAVGGVVSAQCSLEFLELVPREVEFVTARLRTTGAAHHAALQRAGTAAGLLAGSDLHSDLAPAIASLRRDAVCYRAMLNEGASGEPPC